MSKVSQEKKLQEFNGIIDDIFEGIEESKRRELRFWQQEERREIVKQIVKHINIAARQTIKEEMDVIQEKVDNLTELVAVKDRLKEDIENMKSFLITNDVREIFLNDLQGNDFCQNLLVRKPSIAFPTEKEKESEEIVKGILKKISEANQEQLKALDNQHSLLINEVQRQSTEIFRLKEFAEKRKKEGKLLKQQLDEQLQNTLEKQSAEIFKLKILCRLLLVCFLFFIFIISIIFAVAKK